MWTLIACPYKKLVYRWEIPITRHSKVFNTIDCLCDLLFVVFWSILGDYYKVYMKKNHVQFSNT